MKAFLCFLSLIVVLEGCNPLRHYQKVAADHEVTPEKKRVIAPWILMNFPPMVVTKPGKETTKIDTVYDQKSLDSLSQVIKELVKDSAHVNVDSLIQAVKKLCVPRTKYELIVRVDTTTVIDNVAAEAARYDLYQCNNKNMSLTAQVEKLKGDVDGSGQKARTYLLYFIIAAVVALLEAYLLFKPK